MIQLEDKMNKFFNNVKKAQSLPSARIVVMFLFLVVLFIMIAGPVGQLFTSYQVLQVEGAEQECRSVGFQQYRQVYCEEREFDILPENSIYRCDSSSQEFELYQDVKLYLERESRCGSIGDEHCTCVMNAYLHQREDALGQIEELENPSNSIGGIIGGAEIRDEDSSLISDLLAGITDYLYGTDETPQDGEEHDETGIDNLGFNSASMELFRQFSDEHNVELRRLVAFARAIATIETNNRAFDSSGNPTSRFECHVFNRNSNTNVPCTTRSGEAFSRVLSETNYEAFLRASSINEREAYRSTSFGLFQVVGFLYPELGLNSPQELRDRTLTQEGQVDLFLRFILTRRDSILEELQKEGEMNYRRIALRYNGPQYERNQYHTELQTAYERLYQEYSSQRGTSEIIAILNVNAPELYTQIRSPEVSNPQFGTRLRYEVQGKTRNKGLAPQLEQILYATAQELDVTVHIYSAGQCPATHPTCGNERTGSRRHDFGNAADIYITRNNQRICNGNPDFDRFVRVAFRNGIQAGGSSPGYMGNCNMHLDIVGTRLGGGIHWRSTSNFVSALTQGIRDREQQATTS